jgi:hypothetical protein
MSVGVVGVTSSGRIHRVVPRYCCWRWGMLSTLLLNVMMMMSMMRVVGVMMRMGIGVVGVLVVVMR